MKLIKYGDQRFAFAMSREEAVKVVQDLVGQLGDVGAAGSKEHVATCDDDPRLAGRFAFMVKSDG